MSICSSLSSRTFQSTPSARRATTSETSALSLLKYFNPRPPRGERHRALPLIVRQFAISIHALREESDPSLRNHPRKLPISIHALREESDLVIASIISASSRFQSTPSARRATSPAWWWTTPLKNFNPRPPRGERPLGVFQSCASICISIHALREESDYSLLSLSSWVRYFNPRPPRGERRLELNNEMTDHIFQSTPSARRATEKRPDPTPRRGISIHALREESDLSIFGFVTIVAISIHALREESDGWPTPRTAEEVLFQSTPSARRATFQSQTTKPTLANFNPRPPRGERPIPALS